MTKDEISALCVDQLADILRIPKEQVDVNAQFTRLGLDSAMTIYLIMELEDRLNLELEREMLVDYPTIEALSAQLARHTDASAAEKQPG